MSEQPSIKLELQVPAQRLLSQYITNNKNIEEQVKKGIENALNDLYKDDNLASLIEQEVYRTLRLSFSNWKISRIVKDVLEEKLHDFLVNKAEEFANKILNKNYN